MKWLAAVRPDADRPHGVIIFIWALAVAAGALTWLIVAQRVSDSRQTYLVNAQRDLANLTRVSQEHATRTLRSADQVIRFVRDRYLEMGNKLNLMDLTEKGVIDAEIFNQVGIIDEKGIYALSNRPLTGRLDLSDREHFRVHVERDTGELFVSKPVLGRATQKWSIQLTRRINHKDGSFAGVVVVSIDPGYFTRFYGELNLGSAGMSALYGLDGIARARRVGAREEYGNDASSSSLFKADLLVRPIGSMTQRSVVDGVERLYFYRRIPGYALLVMTALDVQDLLSTHDKAARTFMAQAAVVTLLIFALAAVLTRHLLQIRRAFLARQQSQQTLQERTEQLNAILELSPDGFVSFDPAKRVQFVNPAFLQLTRLEAPGLIGLDESGFSAVLARQCNPTQRFSGVSALRARLLSRQPSAWEQIEIAGDAPCTLQVGMRLGATQAISHILYFRDVTREAEIDRMKSDFLATAAHELRTPMASIYGFSEVLQSQDFSPQEQKELLGIVHGQSKAMSDILNELLDLARIEARKGKDFRFNYLNLHQLLAELVKATKVADGRAAPALHLPENSLWVMADAGKLKQAIQNVISNAYKYSPGGGAVDITVQEVMGPDGQPAEVQIQVSDYGIGMSPDQTRRVFERFYRADTSGKIPGTGLGMSIVKEIIELHHGRVEVQSQLGQGTQVTLSIPASTGEAPKT